MQRKTIAYALGLLAIAACGGGDGDDPAPGPSGPRTKDGITIKPEVRVLDDAALASIAAWDAATGRLTLPASTPLAAGNVVAGGVGPKTPAGLLRRVTSVSVQGGVQTCETTQASLADAVESGRIDVKVGLSKGALESATPKKSGVVPQAVAGASGPGVVPQVLAQGAPPTSGDQFVMGLTDVVLADADGDSATRDDQVRLSGSASIEPSLDFVFDASLAGVKEVSASLRLKTALTYSLRGSYGAKFDEPTTLASYIFTPILVYAGPLPLVFVPTLDVVLRPSGELKVALAAEGTAVVEGRAGVGYKDGSFGPILDGDARHENASTAVAGTLTAKIEAGPDFAVKLYGVAGPYASLHGYAKLVGDATAEAGACYTLSVGFEAKAGVDLSALSLFGIGLKDYATPPLGKDFPVAKGACDPSSEGLNPEAKNFAFELSNEKPLEARALLPLPDGSFVVALQGTDHAFVARVRPDGSLSWSTGLDGVFGVQGLAPAGDGRILVGGNHVLAPWVAKIDLDGNLLWSKVYTPSVSEVRGFAATPGGKAVLVGGVLIEGSNYDEFALAVDGEGAPLWGASYDGGSEATEVRPTADGVVVSGRTVSQSGASNAGHVMRLSEDGAVVWNRRLGGSVSFLDSVDATAGGGFVTSGLGLVGMPVVRLSASGEVVSDHLLYDRAQRLLEFSAARVRAAPGGGVALAGARDFGGSADGLLAAVGDDDVVRFASAFGGAQEDVFRLLLPVDRGFVALGDSASFGERRLAVGLRTTAAGLGELSGFTRSALTLSFDPGGTVIEPGDQLPALESDAPAVQRTPIAFAVDPAGDAATQGASKLTWSKR